MPDDPTRHAVPTPVKAEFDLSALTDTERRYWTAREKGQRWKTMEPKDPNRARTVYMKAKSKLERLWLQREQESRTLAAISTPEARSILHIAKEEGVHPEAAKFMARKADRHYVNLMAAEKEVQKSTLRNLYGHTSLKILESITQKDIDDASLRDKLVAAAVATDKSLLLDGQPTEVYSIKELASLDELSKALMGELRRRGLEIEPNATPARVGVLDIEFSPS